ncbi:hypothetical protein ACLOJK_041508 [Asimina triloba]
MTVATRSNGRRWGNSGRAAPIADPVGRSEENRPKPIFHNEADASGDGSVGKLRQRAARSGIFSGFVDRHDGCSGVAWRRRRRQPAGSSKQQCSTSSP